MAQVYYPKSTSTKYLEGAVAGLAGGVVVAIVVTLADAIIPDRSWWTSLAALGGILTGATNFNTAGTDWGSWIIGLAITLIAFALFGMGFVGYLPLIRTYKFNIFLAGALYGLLLWIVIDVLILNLLTSGRLNLIVLLVADLLAGMAMAWWLQWINGSKK
jgi:hypothetical protein